jgi:hypothetical protein
MATGNVIVTVVDVGQGQCTFVEIYDDDGIAPTLLQTLLFDCGSNKTSTQTFINIDYIVAKIAGMAIPTIDCLFFSHGDTDHTNLVWSLLDKIDIAIAPKLLVITKTIYGGAFSHYNKNSKNILNAVTTRGYCNDVKPAGGSNFSNYNPVSKSYSGSLWESTDTSVKVVAVCANVISDNPDWSKNNLPIPGGNPEALNQISLVAALYYANKSYVICGDATYITMGAVIKRFNNDPPLFDNNVMVTLPHHGARKTGFAVPSSEQASFKAVLIVQYFADLFKSDTVSVSAFRHHGHPSLELMATFLPKLKTPILRDPRLKQKNTHRVTANIDYQIILYDPDAIVVDDDDDSGISSPVIEKNRERSFETHTNTFTTRYYTGAVATFSYDIGNLIAEKSEGLVTPDDPINEFASWQYITANNGSCSLNGYGNLALPLNSFTVAPEALAVLNNRVHQTSQINSVPSTPIIRIKTKQKVFAPTSNKPLYNLSIKQFI